MANIIIISVVILFFMFLLSICAHIFLKKLALKRAGDIIAKNPDKKINGIYENGIIKNNRFTEWGKIMHYYYFYNKKIIFKHKNNKEIVMEISGKYLDKAFDLLKKKGINCIDPMA